MTRETTSERKDTASASGQMYQESAAYIESFLAFLQLQELRVGARSLEVELVACGLDEYDEKMLQ